MMENGDKETAEEEEDFDSLAEKSSRPIIRGAEGAISKWPPSTLKFKFTIPEPFKMTLRDEIKCIRGKHRVEEGFQVKESLEECVKQFRAKPVPANTFLPLYEKITKDKEMNRRKAREQHMAKVMSEVQPFAFEERDEAQKQSSHRRRSYSVPNMMEDNEGLENLSIAAREMSSASAAPITRHAEPKRRPKKTLADMMEEKELLRECRIKSRAEKLLKMSSLPQNMAQRQEKLKNTPKLGLNCEDADEAKKPSISCQRTSLQKHQARSYEKIFVSVPRPNSLNRALLPSAIKVKEDQREVRSRRRRSKTISDFDDMDSVEMFPPPKMTLAALLRESANRKRKEEEKMPRKAFRKETEEFELKQRVVTKSRNFQLQRKSETIEEKQKNFRDSDKVRLREYHREIKNMTERLKNRPLLMEQQSQLSAARKVDKRFREKLLREGLDEGIVLKYSQKAGSSATRSLSETSSRKSNHDDDDDNDKDSTLGSEALDRNDGSSSDTSGTEGGEEEEEDSQEEYSTFSEKTLRDDDL